MYKNLKIAKKLLFGFGAVIIMAGIMIAVAMMFLIQVGSLTNQMYEGPYVSTTEAMGIRRDINVLGKDLRSAMLEKNIDKYMDMLLSDENSVVSRIATLRTSFGGDVKMIDDVESSFQEMLVQKDRVVQTARSQGYDAATKIVLGDYVAAFQKVADASMVLYDDADARGASFNKQSQDNAQLALMISITVFLLISGCAIAIAVITTKAITRPVKQIENAARQLSEGNLKTDIAYHAKDELGMLADSMRATIGVLDGIISDVDYCLNEMGNSNFDIESKNKDGYIGNFGSILISMRKINTNLSTTLSQINESADQVSSGSDQVSSGAQALSQGATEQASSVQELAATITEISQQIHQNAENAQTASGMVNEVSKEMSTSNEKMQQMTSAMQEISHSSTEIGKIIKTIEDIAFQTNILALNAAVEAARAGAAGKGFAVVADEVRNLASKSAEASKNTAALIETSIKSVENGTYIAGETAESLMKAVDGARKVTDTINQISSASKEQAEAVSQVTTGIDQISSVVQTNSATAEQSAAASEELSSQAQMLKSLVSQFKLKEYEGSHSEAVQAPVRRKLAQSSALPASIGSVNGW